MNHVLMRLRHKFECIRDIAAHCSEHVVTKEVVIEDATIDTSWAVMKLVTLNIREYVR